MNAKKIASKNIYVIGNNTIHLMEGVEPWPGLYIRTPVIGLHLWS